MLLFKAPTARVATRMFFAIQIIMLVDILDETRSDELERNLCESI